MHSENSEYLDVLYKGIDFKRRLSTNCQQMKLKAYLREIHSLARNTRQIRNFMVIPSRRGDMIFSEPSEQLGVLYKGNDFKACLRKIDSLV